MRYLNYVLRAPISIKRGERSQEIPRNWLFSRISREKVKQMSPIIAKEMSPGNRLERERRLLMLKLSLEQNNYHIDPLLIAGGMIREAKDEATSSHLGKA